MKKLIATIMAMTAVMAFTGCGGSDSRNVDGNATNTSTVPTANGDQIVIDNGQDVAIGDDNSIQITCGDGGCGDITVYKKVNTEY